MPHVTAIPADLMAAAGDQNQMIAGTPEKDTFRDQFQREEDTKCVRKSSGLSGSSVT